MSGRRWARVTPYGSCHLLDVRVRWGRVMVVGVQVGWSGWAGLGWVGVGGVGVGLGWSGVGVELG